MKVLLFLVFASAATLTVCAVFDQKQDAIKEIDAKFKDVNSVKSNILGAIDIEKEGIKTNLEKDVEKYLYKKGNDTTTEVQGAANEVIRATIAEAKPMTVIYCIRDTTSNGLQSITETSKTNLKKLRDILIQKTNKIEFDEKIVGAITEELSHLLNDAKEKIKGDKGPIKEIKTQALKNCQSATSLLHEIEIHIHDPILAKEYVKMRQEIDKNFGTLKTSLQTQLKNCLKIKMI